MAKPATSRILNLLRAQTVVINGAYDAAIDKLSESAAQTALLEGLQGVKPTTPAEDLDEDARQTLIDRVTSLVERTLKDLGKELNRSFSEIGRHEVAELLKQLPKPAVTIGFDSLNPRAQAVAERNLLQFIREFTEQQREAVRVALSTSLSTGQGPQTVARAIKNSIGLTGHQLQAVSSYQTSLQTGSRDALERAMRDRRFDPSVERAVEGVRPLSAQQIITMTDRYRQIAVQVRAETISRTEAMRTLNLARDEALRQVVEATGIEPSKITRVWRATHDARVRDSHARMDGQTRGLDEPFTTPAGVELMYPGDPSADPGEVINCRCVVVNRIAL